VNVARSNWTGPDVSTLVLIMQRSKILLWGNRQCSAPDSCLTLDTRYVKKAIYSVVGSRGCHRSVLHTCRL
jgi:hypothetical protein